MSALRIRGAGAPLLGVTTVPGDKSIGHRAVMFAALASGRSRLRGLSGGEDNRRTVRAFEQLGVPLRDEGGAGLLVEGQGLRGLRAPIDPIDCGNSGTTMRLLAGVLAPRPFRTTLVGDRYLEARPMGRVARPLRAMGARVEGRDGAKPGETYPPLVIGPAEAPLRGIDFTSPIASAQVKSAVILAALLAEGRTLVREPARSRDHTERMLAAMGAPITVEDDAVAIDPAGWDGHLAPRDLDVPGDLSSAAFLLGAALLVPGSRVTVRGVGVNQTRTGFLDALRAMGGRLTIEHARDAAGEPFADLTAEAAPLRGARIDGTLALRALDELPLLAALAAHAEGETVIAGAAELRVKESDRIAATAAALRALGADVEEREDGMVIAGRPGALRPGRVESHGDHRIAMAACVCALGLRPDGDTRIDDTDNIATSFPGFAPTLAALGADLDAIP